MDTPVLADLLRPTLIIDMWTLVEVKRPCPEGYMMGLAGESKRKSNESALPDDKMNIYIYIYIYIYILFGAVESELGVCPSGQENYLKHLNFPGKERNVTEIIEQ